MNGEETMSRTDYYHVDNAPKANSIVTAASAVVVNKKGEILIHRRTDNNLWSLLGGAMEPGESIAETITREVFEESGLHVHVVKMIGVYSDPKHIIAYSNGEVRQQFSICFLCAVEAGELKISDESKELKFVSINDIKAYHLHDAQFVRIYDYLKNQKEAFIR